ncbi:MAG: DUF58 domain-containing protein [Nitrososphaerales archaeon]|jgi:uncharacterized protein (DUF58 family)
MGFTGPSIAAALAFSLAVMGLVSLVWFRFSSHSAVISTGVKKLRAFKLETKTVPLEVRANAPRGMRLTLTSVGGFAGLESEFRRHDDGSGELILTPRYAGRSKGLTANFQATDSIGLFARQIIVPLDLVYESLPLALKRPPAPITVYPMSYGDSPSGRKGPGLELYGVSEYQTGQDTRDIMWKKAAGMTDDSLPVREREAEVRGSLSVTVAVEARSDEEAARRNDLVAEAIAQVGSRSLSAGTRLEIARAGPSGGSPSKVRASNLKELADATLIPWTSGEQVMLGSMMRTPPDILIIGASELRDGSIVAPARSTHLLLLDDEKLPLARVPSGVTVFSGKEELTGLATSVLAG